MKTIKKEKKLKPIIEKVASTPPDEMTSGGEGLAQPDSTSTLVAKINSFSGDFGRVDINLLRDKVNEIIDFINKH